MTQTIYSHTFPNGLALLAEPMDSLESAAFTLRVPAGTAIEPADRAGLAGLTCEMSLRGAGSLDNRQLITALDNLGVERGESVSDAHCRYGGATLADNLLPALGVYAQIMREPHLPESLFEASRQICLQELSSVDDDPAQKVMIELRRHHYPEPWGRASEGDEAGLEASTLSDVRQHFKRGFRPNGAILGVAGRIDWPRLRDEVERLFGDWPTVDVPEPIAASGVPGNAHLEHESNQTQVGIAYASVPYRQPDFFQAWGAVGVLSGGMSARFFTEVREKRGLCYSVYATHHSLHDRGSILCYAGTSAERAQETLDVMLAELTRLAQGIEQNELDRLKARSKSSLIMQQESSSARSSAITRDWYHLGRVRTLDEVESLVDALSCDSINNYLAAHPPRSFTVVTLGQQPLEVSHGVS